jgi:hypothetical protein
MRCRYATESVHPAGYKLHLPQAHQNLCKSSIILLLLLPPRLWPGIQHCHPAGAVASHSSMTLQLHKAPTRKQLLLLLLPRL